MFIPPCKCSFWVCVCSLCRRNIASHFSVIYCTKKSRDRAVFAVDHSSFTVFYGNQVIRSQTVVGYGSVCTDLPHTSRQPRTWTVLLSLAVAYEKYSNHCFFSSQIALKCRILQGFISISRYRSFLLIYYIFCKKVQNEANHFHL